MNSDLKFQPYVGRFAPSPTGPLHFGSLIAAMASYLDAKTHRGQWLLRMENVDKAREVSGAADDILRTLERFGFEWSEKVIYQDQHTEIYQTILAALIEQGLAYPCSCTRKVIRTSGKMGIDGIIYPGFCRAGLKGKTARAWRLKVDNTNMAFEDLFQGQQSQFVADTVGDFVLKRADGFFAYQLAVVIDDELQGVNYVIRGSDLMDSTPRQLFLQQQLNYTQPTYGHVPVASYPNGDKLSKQTFAAAISDAPVVGTLFQVLTFLGQQPPETLKKVAIADFWDWAITHWQRKNVPRQRQITVNQSPSV